MSTPNQVAVTLPQPLLDKIADHQRKLAHSHRFQTEKGALWETQCGPTRNDVVRHAVHYFFESGEAEMALWEPCPYKDRAIGEPVIRGEDLRFHVARGKRRVSP